MDILQITSALLVLAALFGSVNYLVLRLPAAIGILIVALLASLGLMGLDRLAPGLGLAATSRAFGRCAAEASPAGVARLTRVYWYTLEFGLCEEDGRLVAMGAGLMSSVGELQRSVEGADAVREPLDLDALACPDGACPSVVDGRLTRRDVHHLQPSFVRSRVDEVEAALVAAGLDLETASLPTAP